MSFTWPIDRSCLDSGNDTAGQEVLDRAEDLAVHVLWALSGRQFGLRLVTARPCPPLGYPIPPFLPVTYGLEWANWSCGCLSSCRHSAPSKVHLPGPVAAPTEGDPIIVNIAGEDLDSSEYALEGDVLYRTGGKNWPSQNLARPLGETGTWSVTYRQGIPCPPGVDRLTAIVAKEFASACSGDECRIPRTLIAASQRGVTHDFDPAKILAAGKTGLPEVDLWLSAVNPHHLQQPPSVV